jgi:hypothetical protein
MNNNPAGVLPPVDDNEATRRALNSGERWTKVTAIVGGAVSYLPRHSADLYETTRRSPNGGSPTHTRGTEF